MIPKSKYEEDVYPGNHTSVWGSWYNREEGKWGYACCHQCVKNAYCLASNQCCVCWRCHGSLPIYMHISEHRLASRFDAPLAPSLQVGRNRPQRHLLVSITAKTIREDGDVQYIDMDADPTKTLLETLKEKTKIQCRDDWDDSRKDHCGGKGVCGQCVIGLPKDVYARLPSPSDDEMMAIQVNLDPPQ